MMRYRALLILAAGVAACDPTLIPLAARYAPCAENGDCASGLCLVDPGYCTESCATDGDCGGGTCVPASGDRSVCVMDTSSRLDAGVGPGPSLATVLDRLAEARCALTLACDEPSAEDRAFCESVIREGLEEDFRDCEALEELARARYAEIEACATSVRCGGSCPALDEVDYLDVCPLDAGAPPRVDAGAPRDAGALSLTTEQAVVGAWSGSATCGGMTIGFSYFICPGGRLRGVDQIGSHRFLDCGTWDIAPSGRMHTRYTTTAVANGDRYPAEDYYFDYYTDPDALVWVSSCENPVILRRLEGEVTEADCNSGSCTAGGSGPVSCGTDCDCGRCWYCESGTCRYGGEGPYGCYRGCGDF